MSPNVVFGEKVDVDPARKNLGLKCAVTSTAFDIPIWVTCYIRGIVDHVLGDAS